MKKDNMAWVQFFVPIGTLGQHCWIYFKVEIILSMIPTAFQFFDLCAAMMMMHLDNEEI